MVTEIVTDIESLDDLREEWNKLLISSAANNLFLTWEWISSWCTHMLKSSETPIIITAREGNRLVGIAPLIKDRHRFLGDYFHIIGQQYSYHLGFIAERGKEDDVFSALFDYLFNVVGKKFFVLDFLHLDEDPHFEAIYMNGIKRRGYFVDKRIHNSCKVLILPEKFDEYLEKGILSNNLRINLKKDLKRLSADYDFQCFDADLKDFKAYWQELLFLHRKEMSDQKKQSVLSSNSFPGHIENSCEMLKVNESVQLSVLRINDVTASVLLGIIYNEVFNAITIGLSSDLKQKFPWVNFSVLSHTFAIKSAIESGCREFDFLGGDHDFKNKMGGKEKGGIRITVYRSGFHKIVVGVLSRYIVPLFRKA